MVVIEAFVAADRSEELLGVAALLAQAPVPRWLGLPEIRGECDRQPRRRLLA